MQGYWTEERIEVLKSLYASGKSCSQIGAVIGVSRNAIIGKVHRMGLPLRGQAKPKPQLDPEALAAKALRAKDAQMENQRIRRALARGEQMEKHPIQLLEFSGALNIPLVDLRDYSASEANQCRFIPAEPPGPEYFACGTETMPGDSYCPHCMQITHRNQFEMSETDKLKKRAHFIRIGNASKIGRTLDMGDAA